MSARATTMTPTQLRARLDRGDPLRIGRGRGDRGQRTVAGGEFGQRQRVGRSGQGTGGKAVSPRGNG